MGGEARLNYACYYLGKGAAVTKVSGDFSVQDVVQGLVNLIEELIAMVLRTLDNLAKGTTKVR